MLKWLAPTFVFQEYLWFFLSYNEDKNISFTYEERKWHITFLLSSELIVEFYNILIILVKKYSIFFYFIKASANTLFYLSIVFINN